MAHTAGNGIEDLYRSVINDVINQCKEAFSDENVDVDILRQIQKNWEEKVNESGAVDLSQRSQDIPASRPPTKPNMPGKPGPSGIGVYTDAGASTSDPQQIGYPFINHEQLVNAGVASQMQYSQPIIQQIIFSNSQQLPPGTTIPASIDGNIVHLTPEQFKNFHCVPQVDGNGDFEGLDLKGKPSDYRVDLDLKKGEMIIRKKKSKKDKGLDKDHMKVLTKKLKKLASEPDDNDERKKKLMEMLPQVDGGPTMSSSSSDSEEDEDEHISRIVERIDDKAEADDDDGGDEEPLNSADDQSDDEDLDTLFESNNIIVCQFEKVNRARTKWKFTLKDGIMHLNGKDYCFQKCTGEAEW